MIRCGSGSRAGRPTGVDPLAREAEVALAGHHGEDRPIGELARQREEARPDDPEMDRQPLGRSVDEVSIAHAEDLTAMVDRASVEERPDDRHAVADRRVTGERGMTPICSIHAGTPRPMPGHEPSRVRA